MVDVLLATGGTAVAVGALVLAAVWIGYRGRPVAGQETVPLDVLLDGPDDGPDGSGYQPRHLVCDDPTVLLDVPFETPAQRPHICDSSSGTVLETPAP